MSEYTPQHPVRPVDPDTSGTDPTLTDLVAGDPPVPITVWRTARTAADAGRAIGARLAYRLVSAYTRPGDTVVDCTDDHVLITACLAGRRRHRRAWFTDGPGLLIGPVPTPADPHLSDEQQSDESVGDVPDVRAWFGDDLTDSPTRGDDPTDDEGTTNKTGLLVAAWPLDANDTTNRVRLACLLAACARLLRPGGCLVLVVAVPAGTIATPEDFSPLATAAAAVGLGYLQHIVAVTADTEAEAFVYHITDEELLALARHTAGQQWPVTHHRIHADLLVFTTASAPAQGRPRRDGGDSRD